MKLTGRNLIFLSLLVAVLVGATIFFVVRGNTKEVNNTLNQYDEIKKIDENTEIIKEIPAEALAQPKTFKDLVNQVERKVSVVKDTFFSKPNVLLNVTFTSQAPLSVWDELHEEACEEASMIMVESYVKKLALDKDIAEQKIQEQVKWQTEHGYDIDINIRQAQDILKTYYKVENTEVINNPTLDDMKKRLSEGKVIIIPAAGRQLGNPYYTPPGPEYHMLVIIGYDDAQKEFITNDPGTRRGAGYRFNYDVLMNAIHDWNNGDVENGGKVVLAVGI
jgi:hypothetical protein